MKKRMRLSAVSLITGLCILLPGIASADGGDPGPPTPKRLIHTGSIIWGGGHHGRGQRAGWGIVLSSVLVNLERMYF